ncbi:hypothetical protein BASA62_001248 [Batrachochytrium salamandrivorans]|nr:hypothetical protein BASA62_001248 [Batrachochytrium salamandrivorans]
MYPSWLLVLVAVTAPWTIASEVDLSNLNDLSEMAEPADSVPIDFSSRELDIVTNEAPSPSTPLLVSGVQGIPIVLPISGSALPTTDASTTTTSAAVFSEPAFPESSTNDLPTVTLAVTTSPAAYGTTDIKSTTPDVIPIQSDTTDATKNATLTGSSTKEGSHRRKKNHRKMRHIPYGGGYHSRKGTRGNRRRTRHGNRRMHTTTTPYSTWNDRTSRQETTQTTWVSSTLSSTTTSVVLESTVVTTTLVQTETLPTTIGRVIIITTTSDCTKSQTTSHTTLEPKSPSYPKSTDYPVIPTVPKQTSIDVITLPTTIGRVIIITTTPDCTKSQTTSHTTLEPKSSSYPKSTDYPCDTNVPKQTSIDVITLPTTVGRVIITTETPESTESWTIPVETQDPEIPSYPESTDYPVIPIIPIETSIDVITLPTTVGRVIITTDTPESTESWTTPTSIDVITLPTTVGRVIITTDTPESTESWTIPVETQEPKIPSYPESTDYPVIPIVPTPTSIDVITLPTTVGRVVVPTDTEIPAKPDISRLHRGSHCP